MPPKHGNSTRRKCGAATWQTHLRSLLSALRLRSPRGWSKRRWAAWIVAAASVVAPGVYKLTVSPKSQAREATPSIVQDGGVHVGDNVVGQKIIIELSKANERSEGK